MLPPVLFVLPPVLFVLPPVLFTVDGQLFTVRLKTQPGGAGASAAFSERISGVTVQVIPRLARAPRMRPEGKAR